MPEVGYSLDKWPVHFRAQTHTFAMELTHLKKILSLWAAGKTVPSTIHVDTGRACKEGFLGIATLKPGTLLF